QGPVLAQAAPSLILNLERRTSNPSYNPFVQEAVFAAVVRALERGEDAALVTIISTEGSTPQRVGAKLLVHADGRTIGTIGGGCYESDAAGKAREIIRTRRATVVRYDLSDTLAEENGLICGGRMEVFIEPLDPSPRLYVVGAGHVSQHLARAAHAVGFRITVVDDREKFANRDRFPDATDLVADDIASWLRAADLPPTAFVVVVTRGHTHDLDAMLALADRPLRYVGMIGSRAKVARIKEALADSGASAAWLSGVYAPVGLHIGAVTPEEIAISIVAELIAVRRGIPAHGPGSPTHMRTRE
ncbi:MAG: XdhC/CoxI family protein, partial [Acidobacteria bacterium]|nr:XdhC/CoxI family protein [Acidobacteriota bacterium]